MHAENLQAIVLSTIDYGDSDRIASLFSLEHGRIKAFARGARNSRKRFGAALEGFARIEAQVRLKEGLAGLRQAEIVTIYPHIRGNLSAIAHALYSCEVVETMTPEGHPLPRLYRLLAAYLDRLETGTTAETDRRFFEINLLNILGYRPSLEICSRCNSPFGAAGALLQESGEPVCRACAETGRPLHSSTLKALNACMATGIFGKVAFPPDLLAEGGVVLDRSIATHAGRRLKSLEFLGQITP